MKTTVLVHIAALAAPRRAAPTPVLRAVWRLSVSPGGRPTLCCAWVPGPPTSATKAVAA